MQENYEYIQKGFRILLKPLSEFVGKEMYSAYGSRWWDKVLESANNRWELPESGTYSELVSSMDIACCFKVLNRNWFEAFNNKIPVVCRSWANELLGIRNSLSHAGQDDFDRRTAERALDTMALLCRKIDTVTAAQLEELYQEVRTADPVYKKESGVDQPEMHPGYFEKSEESLLKLIGTDKVIKTTLTRKVTYGGETYIYPVYRVRLEELFYNDQNDRISTWISQYESENGKDTLQDLSTETYNRIIENFVVESNPESIEKTKKNISLVGQREPGVTLADGRIVDGNRRFTCLRKIQRETQEPVYFETVIMDVDIQQDKKQIKLLELAIQHGEEKKVDYDPIDYSIGTYRDVVQTKLLTVEEYAASTTESVQEVKQRIEIAEVIVKFLEHIRLPEQYHVAREYSVHDQFREMLQFSKKLSDEDKNTVQMITFNNAMMHAITDQRKFIRDIRNLIRTDTYHAYFDEQKRLNEEIQSRFAETAIHSKEDVDQFALNNETIGQELQLSMERALLKSRAQQLRTKPAENVTKSFDLLSEIDPRLFVRMNEEDKEALRQSLDELNTLIKKFKRQLSK